MRKQGGFAMPGTIIFLILLISFLMYETNMLLSDKKFYSEIEQSFFMEELVDRAISDIKRDLQQKEKEDVFYFSMKEEKRVESTSLKMMVLSFRCTVLQNREFSTQ